MRFYEDMAVGETDEFGARTVSKEEILEFAEQFDPQPIHVDEAAAAESMFGGIIASGWHTASLTMRLLVDNLINDMASMGARGVDDLRWQLPVYPGDTLSVRTEVTEKRVSDSDPNRGYVNSEVETLNQNDRVVMSLTSLAMVERRAEE
jgi:acyl dehydratase